MIWKFFSKAHPNRELFTYIHNTFHVKPKNLSLYETALRHASAADEIRPGVKNSNERLEFLGDAILDSIVAHYLFSKYPALTEGELTKMKSKIVRRDNLNSIGYELKLYEFLQVSIGRQEIHESLIGNALEALFGALFLDKGYKVTKEIALKLLKEHGLDERVHLDVDYKSKLHEWGQKTRRHLVYHVREQRNMGAQMLYTIALELDGKEVGRGTGGSKKAAEQSAAEAAAKVILTN
ncbi:MAG: ribonuclease [Bacteroidota bacterium]|jgi:ribonuclease-3